ncbi:Tyrosine recombinase XerC [subsurface metagenome]
MTKQIVRIIDQAAIYEKMLSIKDCYSDDARLFVDFLKSTGGLNLGSLLDYAEYLDQEHDGKRYSANTFNKRIIGAKQRIKSIMHQPGVTEIMRFKLQETLDSIKLKKINSQTVEEAKTLTPEEIRQLIEGCTDKTVSLMIEFLFYSTAARVSEMLNVLLSDMTKHKGKRDEYYAIRILGKGGKERFVVTTKDLVDRIRKYFKGKKWLFEHSGKRYNSISITQRINFQALRVLGKDATAHTFRHSWATNEVRKHPGRIKAISTYLGHSAVSTTLSMYVHDSFSPEEILDSPHGRKKGQK